MTKEAIFTDDTAWNDYWYAKHKKSDKKRCKRCLYDEDTPAIEFDENGICNYCKHHDELEMQYPGGDIGWSRLEAIAEKIKHEGRNKKYDCVIGVSGGCDSSYIVHIAKELGLRPLAVHYDNTWNSTIAVENIHNLLKKLDIDLYTYVVDNEEYDDLYKSIMKAGVIDLEIPTDLALASVLNKAAVKNGVRYIIEGHSFRTEGIAPLGWVYMDSKYVHSMQKRYGNKKLKSLPNMWLSTQLKWMLVNRLKKIRPLWYIDYKKDDAKQLLNQNYGWQWYGGHHLENRIAAFYHSFYLPRKFDVDTRTLGYSALVRNGQMERKEALELLAEPQQTDWEIVDMVKKRLDLNQKQFVELMMSPKHTYRDFDTYKQTFERMRPFFYLMAKMELIPMSFYIKYTSKSNI